MPCVSWFIGLSCLWKAWRHYSCCSRPAWYFQAEGGGHEACFSLTICLMPFLHYLLASFNLISLTLTAVAGNLVKLWRELHCGDKNTLRHRQERFVIVHWNKPSKTESVEERVGQRCVALCLPSPFSFLLGCSTQCFTRRLSSTGDWTILHREGNMWSILLFIIVFLPTSVLMRLPQSIPSCHVFFMWTSLFLISVYKLPNPFGEAFRFSSLSARKNTDTLLLSAVSKAFQSKSRCESSSANCRSRCESFRSGMKAITMIQHSNLNLSNLLEHHLAESFQCSEIEPLFCVRLCYKICAVSLGTLDVGCRHSVSFLKSLVLQEKNTDRFNSGYNNINMQNESATCNWKYNWTNTNTITKKKIQIRTVWASISKKKKKADTLYYNTLCGCCEVSTNITQNILKIKGIMTYIKLFILFHWVILIQPPRPGNKIWNLRGMTTYIRCPWHYILYIFYCLKSYWKMNQVSRPHI